jgi:hypothetical protein
MSELLRDTVAGFVFRTITAKKFLRYPEEIPGFKIPAPVPDNASEDSAEKSVDEKDNAEQEPSSSSRRNEDLERGNTMQPTASQAIHSVVTKDGVILVDWYSEGGFEHLHASSAHVVINTQNRRFCKPQELERTKENNSWWYHLVSH